MTTQAADAPAERKAHRYGRVSSGRQNEAGAVSIPDQDRITLACVERKGWQDGGFLHDEQTGTNADRPGWQATVAKCERGDAIVVHKVDRFARSLYAAVTEMKRLADLGIGLILVEPEFDTTTPFGRAFLGILFVFAALDRDLMVERMANGAYAKARDGRWPSSGRARPFGFRVEGSKREARLVLDVGGEFDTANRVAALLVDEGRSPADVCWLLNNAGMTPRHAAAWTTPVLRDVFTKRSLCGEVWWGRTDYRASGDYGEAVRIEGVPEVMSPERFEQVQKALARNSNGSNPDRRDWPLSGGRMTSPCGLTYTGRHRHDRDRAQYKCQGRKWRPYKGWKPCGCPLLDAEPIENRVWALVTGLLGDGDKLMEYARRHFGVADGTAAGQAAEAADIDRQVGQLEQSLASAMANGIRAGLDPDALAAATGEIQGELSALRARRDDLAKWAADVTVRKSHLDSLAALATDFRARVRTMGPAERTQVLDWLDIAVTILDDSTTPLFRVGGHVRPHEWWNPPEVPDRTSPAGVPDIPFDIAA